MRKLFFIVMASLFLISCNSGDNFPRIENIKKGSKWTLKIGSTPTEVYTQLQELNKEKRVDVVEIIGRKDFQKPEEVRNIIPLYDYLYLESNDGSKTPFRIHISFKDGKVAYIANYAKSFTVKAKWPSDAPDEIAIFKDDSVDEIYNKLLSIYQISEYKNTKIQLYNKTLNLPFDPDMSNYNEWFFTFFERIGTGRDSRSSVKLVFKNGKLNNIRHQYEEFDFILY